MFSNRSLIAASAAATVAVAGLGSAQYVQLLDDSDIFGTSGNTQATNVVVDGTTAYFTLSGGGSANIAKIENLGSTNDFSILVDSSTLSGIGVTSIASTGFDLVGTDLIFADSVDDATYIVDTTASNVASVLSSKAALDLFIGGTGPTMFVVASSSAGTFMYEGDTDSIIAVTGVNSFATEVTDTALSNLSGDDTITNLAISGDTLFFENGGGLFSWNTASNTGSELIDTSSVDSAIGSSTAAVSNITFRVGPDGRLYFLEFDTDDIWAYDPTDGSFELILNTEELNLGPAFENTTSFAIADFTFVDGELAFLIDDDFGPAGSSGATAFGGLYRVPEPATAALLAIGAGLIAVRRRRA
ncbi:MAG: PEP-CTERM sorting domain-containing protein [Planctomycetota bacterium]